MAAMITRLLPERERLGSLARVDRNVVRDALTFANAVGALTCTKPGRSPPCRRAPKSNSSWRGRGTVDGCCQDRSGSSVRLRYGL